MLGKCYHLGIPPRPTVGHDRIGQRDGDSSCDLWGTISRGVGLVGRF